MNLVRRDSGRITVFGKDSLEYEAEVKRSIGFVYDVPRFYDDARLTDLALAIAPFYPGWDQACFDTLVGELGLPMRRKFKKLSAGMKTQFALCVALSHDADLILMDEPMAGLDPIVRRELLDRLRDILQDERKSILFSTHITSDLERVADFITLLQAGRLVFSLPKDQLLESWALVKGDRALLNDDARAHLRGWREGEHGFEGLTDDARKVHSYFAGGILVERASLEDIMYFTTTRRGALECTH